MDDKQLDLLLYWIKERECVRIRKESGEDIPWTKDLILRKYRFCNVRRMDDRVSRWLLNNWYTPNKNHKNTVLACTLARQLNNTDTLKEIGFPFTWRPQRVLDILNKRSKRGLKNFSPAYMITGTLGGTKAEQVILKVADTIFSDPPSISTESMRKTWSHLKRYPGFGSFISGQVVADLRWAIDGTWKDKSYWAAMGPGSKRGMNRLLGVHTHSKISEEEFQDNLVKVMNHCRISLDSAIARKLEAIDYQNCLCEFDKYSRTLNNQGRPKRRYP